MSDMDTLASVASELDGVMMPVNFDSVTLRMSDMDTLASVASELDGVVLPVNFDSVTLRMSDMDISLFCLIELDSVEIILEKSISDKLSLSCKMFVTLS